jgi:TRAP-type C4-dicarboxylate transport system permease large subunit
MAMITLPEMKRYKYDDSLAAGSIACGGTLGIMIPPSIGFIIYGIITQESIGKLFIAGIFPGILQAILLLITIYISCKLNPALGPPGPSTSLKEKIVSLKNTWIV